MMNQNIFPQEPDEVKEAVQRALECLKKTKPAGEKGGKVSRTWQRRMPGGLPKAAVLAAALLLISGVTLTAVGAVNLYRQRMEEMDQEELDTYYDIAGKSDGGNLNRSLTQEEIDRKKQLEEAYEAGEILPQSQAQHLEGTEEYAQEGVGLDVTSRTWMLPEETLSDEELLEIIDEQHKEAYSIYEKNRQRILAQGNWESRMEAMSESEVDRIYRIANTTEDLSGGYSRELTEKERQRYEELKKGYEEENLVPAAEIQVIPRPEDYTGQGAAICDLDADYYLPEGPLTDEDLLEIIDFEHKVSYCFSRINTEVQQGLRDGYPPSGLEKQD